MNWDDLALSTARTSIRHSSDEDFFLNGIDHIFSPKIADLVPPSMNGLTFGEVARGYVLLVYSQGTGRKATEKLKSLREESGVETDDSGIGSTLSFSSTSSMSLSPTCNDNNAATFANTSPSTSPPNHHRYATRQTHH